MLQGRGWLDTVAWCWCVGRWSYRWALGVGTENGGHRSGVPVASSIPRWPKVHHCDDATGSTSLPNQPTRCTMLLACRNCSVCYNLPLHIYGPCTNITTFSNNNRGHTCVCMEYMKAPKMFLGADSGRYAAERRERRALGHPFDLGPLTRTGNAGGSNRPIATMRGTHVCMYR